jgi:hypothetical protein
MIERQNLIEALLAAYPNVEFHHRELTIAVYADGLIDLDCEEIEGAIARLIKTSTELPTIADLRHAAASLRIGEDILNEQVEPFLETGVLPEPGELLAADDFHGVFPRSV